jgi:hypothetical protein
MTTACGNGRPGRAPADLALQGNCFLFSILAARPDFTVKQQWRLTGEKDHVVSMFWPNQLNNLVIEVHGSR